MAKKHAQEHAEHKGEHHEDQQEEKELATTETDKAVDDIVQEEGTELLDKQDAPKTPEPPESSEAKKQNWFKRCWHGFMHHKKWTFPATLLALVGILLAAPFTRYPILATSGVKQSYTLTVLDSTTKKPVTNAKVDLNGTSATTNNKGQATIRGNVGKQTATISKSYYKSASISVFVGLKRTHNTSKISISATGRQVPITVLNAITKKPVENATVKTKDATAKTDKAGKAIIVLPTTAKNQKATITSDGYNAATANIEVTGSVVDANTLTVTPAGKVYFLSNASGTVDVISANYDGTNRQTVLAGTGKENNDAQLFPTADKGYLALATNRDGNKYASIYLINTSNNKLTTVDEGADASFSVTGWSGHHLIYTVTRNNIAVSQPKRAALKSYNADSNKITTVQQTEAEQGTWSGDYAYQDIAAIQIVGDKVLYATIWHEANGHLLAGKKTQFIRVDVDGSSKKILREITLQNGQTMYISARAVTPQDIYFTINQYGSYYAAASATAYLKYQNGSMSDVAADAAQNTLNKPWVTYYLSPSEKQTFWGEYRDGKQTLFVGDQDAENAKQIASQSEYSAYGWASDDYVLVTKGHSELYIMSTAGGPPIKVADYLSGSYEGR